MRYKKTEEQEEKEIMTKKRRKLRPLSPEVEFLSSLHLSFSQEELDADPLLAAIVEDRRERE